MSFISKIENVWHKKDGAESHQIAVVEQEFDIVLPDDYKESDRIRTQAGNV